MLTLSTRPIASQLALFTLVQVHAASAQPAAPPPLPRHRLPDGTGSLAAGLALTEGNSDTSTVNLAYDEAGYRVPISLQSTGLFLRGSSEGALTARRLVLDVRADRKLSDRTSVFGQAQFLEDESKSIDYLISPTVGISQLLIKTAAAELSIDGGAGFVSEKNPGFDARTSGAITSGQVYKHKITASADINERVAALWKTDDFEDALYIFGIGLAANVWTRTQLKAELLDTFKNLPPTPDIKKNDVAVLLSFVYKYESGKGRLGPLTRRVR